MRDNSEKQPNTLMGWTVINICSQLLRFTKTLKRAGSVELNFFTNIAGDNEMYSIYQVNPRGEDPFSSVNIYLDIQVITIVPLSLSKRYLQQLIKVRSTILSPPL